MKDPLFCNVLAGCALAMLFVTSTANAADGRIVFSGAVVEPTCSTGHESVAHVDTDAGPTTRHLDCSRTTADAGRTYSREVLDLTMASRYHDRLLDYFASYAPLVTGGDAAKVVLRTYD